MGNLSSDSITPSRPFSKVGMDFAGPFLIKPNLPRNEGPWIHEVVPIPVHVHPPNTIGNVTRQTRQHVSSYQQSSSGAGCPKRRRKALCRAVNYGTRVGLRLRKPISMIFR
ncbi:hypothetical protein AVEN_108508-1 [Araneus ventricosus]|uniref:Uncharacterized protein n=1 Tax=Araneus ventricosus TaxID=182803 RepID=A0A4Y2V294_ARAVE|nr:hypothetical protein AVEN_108508-1 [Araneus ventricosus]